MSNADLADFAIEDKGHLRPGKAGLIVAAIAWALVVATLAVVAPSLEAVARDFGTDLGAAMRAIFLASRAWVVVAVAAVLVLLVNSKVREELAKLKAGPGLVRTWMALTVGLPVSILGGMVGTFALWFGGLHGLG